MLKKIFLFLVFILLFNTFHTKAGELEFGWNLVNESGKINDMEFMPDDNYFILGTNVDLQIRKSETGEEIKKYPLGVSEIEFTPDSSKLILLRHFEDSTVRIQKYSLEEMNLINEIIVPKDTDTEGLDIFASNLQLKSMVVDPIRNNIYIIRKRQGYLSGGKQFIQTKIIVYDYETMSEVKELLLTSNETEEYTECLSVSKDGQYLSSISSGKSKLKVWDLNSFEMISDYDICNSQSGNDTWGTSTYVKFSELKADNIYFSGHFEHWKNDNTHYGMFNYNIREGNVIDSTFGVGEKMIGYGYFDFFDNEKRIVKTGSGLIKILNNDTKEIELILQVNSVGDQFKQWNTKVIFSTNTELFIGMAGDYFSSGKYLTDNSTKDIFENEITLYPNPATELASLQINTDTPGIYSLTLNDVNGIEVQKIFTGFLDIGESSFEINTIELVPGAYLIQLKSDSYSETYKLIKE